MSRIPFPNYKLPDVPACLRALADKLDRGEEQAVRAIVVLEQPEGAVTYKAFGAEPFMQAHAIGLCFAVAKEIAP